MLETRPGAAASAATAGSTALTVNGIPCSGVQEIGTKAVGRDQGLNAFTVRQYIGYCGDSKGKAWMRFGSTYVWEQYHALGLEYRANVSITMIPSLVEHGLVTGETRQRVVYSTPARTTADCTQAGSTLLRSGVSLGSTLTTMVC